MSAQPLQFYNRYTGGMEVEHIYGERWLRWAYETRLGRIATRHIASKLWFSRWYGWRMSQPGSRKRIAPFITRYGIDTREMLEGVDTFASFNAFFFRKLKPEARPIYPGTESVVFPADGRHLGFNDYHLAKRFYVKGEQFDLVTLLDGTVSAADLSGATVVLSRLCPVDYHRFHFPYPGLPAATRMAKGPLFSVNPIALMRDISILARNLRAITRVEATFGSYWQVEIGATNVGSIRQTFTAGKPVAKAAEKGYFAFGGSSVITVFPAGTVTLAQDLIDNSLQGVETYARMGDLMGLLTTTPLSQ